MWIPVADIEKYIKCKTDIDVTLQKIDMKRKKDYSAYKFLIPKHKLSMFMDENLWSDGVSFRKFITMRKSDPKEVASKQRFV